MSRRASEQGALDLGRLGEWNFGIGVISSGFRFTLVSTMHHRLDFDKLHSLWESILHAWSPVFYQSILSS